jgi:exosortase
MISRSMKRNGWRSTDLAVVVTVAVLCVAVVWPIWLDIFQIARYSRLQSHILLVPFVAALMVWVRRGRFSCCTRDGMIAGPAIVAVGWLAMRIGPPLAIECLVHLGAIIMLIGSIVAVLGIDPLRHFFPAFIALLLLVPVPGVIREAFIDPVQRMAGELSFFMIESFADISIAGDGGVVTINGQAVPRGDLFDGMIMISHVMLIGFAFAFALPLRTRMRWLVIAASPVAAVLLNMLRMALSVWMFGHMEVEIAAVLHSISGWLVVAAALLSLLIVFQRLQRASVHVTRFTLAYD